jgi:osmotically-inducible protein OsmY
MVKLRKDKDVLIDIENELIWDARVLSDNVDVTVANGIVTLDGKVDSVSAKRAAEQNAWSTLGVLDVNNNLTVDYSSKEVPSDEEIENRINSKFIWDSDLMSYKLEAKVNKGLATITGSVDMLWKKKWATSLAERTHGVIAVKNSIAIAPEEDVTDEIIAEEISESLSRKLLKVDLDKIDVRVKDGVVKFTGKVADYDTWNIVLDTARHTSGVISVKDKLEIEST